MDTIYLDHNATTPTRPEVIEAIAKTLRDAHANSASQHKPGQIARRVLEAAREQTATILGADLLGSRADRLLFTSGGTEANNLAVLGITQARSARSKKPGQLIVSAIEHPSVLEPATHLMEQGWRLDTFGATDQSVARIDDLQPMITNQTALVSLMLGNHETGVMQPVSEAVELCASLDVPLHTDAVQVVGKLPVDFRGLGVNALSIAAHKFGGPLGIGALLVREDLAIEPLEFGGHQQRGLRPGTEPVALAVGMARALELWHTERDAHAEQLTRLRHRFESGLRAGFPNLIVHGMEAKRLPQTSAIAFPGIDAQVLLLALDSVDVACSVGSACSAGSTELSPTLRAMQLPTELIASSLRFSLGATTNQAEVDDAVQRILHVLVELAG